MDAVQPPTTTSAKRHFYQRYVDSAQNTGKRLWDWLNRMTHGYFAYLAQAAKNFSVKGSGESVIFGYWAMFALFPLVTLGVVIATFALGQEGARQTIYNLLSQYVPGSGSTLIRDNINEAISQRGGFGIVGFIGLVYGATGLFTNLQLDLSRIFRDKHQRPLPIQILIGIIMMVMLAVLLTASIVASAVFHAVGSEIIGPKSPLLQLGAWLIPLALNILLFVLIFRFVPRRKISLKGILVGAILGGLVWDLGKNLFGWYVTNLANFGVVYGSLGTVIGLLTWTYLTGCLFSLCAEIAVATDDWLNKEPPAVAVVAQHANKPADTIAPTDETQANNVNREASGPAPIKPS